MKERGGVSGKGQVVVESLSVGWDMVFAADSWDELESFLWEVAMGRREKDERKTN